MLLDDMGSFSMDFKRGKKRKYLILRKMNDDSTPVFCNCSAENTVWCLCFSFSKLQLIIVSVTCDT